MEPVPNAYFRSGVQGDRDDFKNTSENKLNYGTVAKDKNTLDTMEIKVRVTDQKTKNNIWKKNYTFHDTGLRFFDFINNSKRQILTNIICLKFDLSPLSLLPCNYGFSGCNEMFIVRI